MHLTPESQQSSAPATISLADLRDLIHSLRNRAQMESIRAENCKPGATRDRHAWRAEAFVEAAEIIERCMGFSR